MSITEYLVRTKDGRVEGVTLHDGIRMVARKEAAWEPPLVAQLKTPSSAAERQPSGDAAHEGGEQEPQAVAPADAPPPAEISPAPAPARAPRKRSRKASAGKD